MSLSDLGTIVAYIFQLIADLLSGISIGGVSLVVIVVGIFVMHTMIVVWTSPSVSGTKKSSSQKGSDKGGKGDAK